MDSALDQLIDHIARYQKQGFTDAEIHKALEPNELEDTLFEQAFAAIAAKLEEERAARERALEEAAERRRKKQQLELEQKEAEAAKKLSAKKAALSASLRNKHHAVPTDADAEALPQDTAISLHEVPKPADEAEMGQELTSVQGHKKDDDDSTATPLQELEEYSELQDIQRQLSGTSSNQADVQVDYTAGSDATLEAGPATAGVTEPSLTQEMLESIQQPWETANGQVPIVGTFEDPQASAGGYSPVQSPFGNTYPATLSYASPQYQAADSKLTYKARHAIGDSFIAARGNLATYIVAGVLAFIIAASTFLLAALMINKFFVLPFTSLLASPIKIITSVVGSMVVYAAWYIIASTFVITIASLALFDGSQSRISTIEAILAKSLYRIKKVGIAVAAIGGLAFGPLVVVTLIPVVFIIAHASQTIVYLMPTLYLASLVWAGAVGLRYALVPYIAVFERSLTLKNSMERSKHLLEGSQKTLVLASLPVIVFVGSAALLVHYRPQAISHPSNVVIDLLLLVVAVAIANAAMVMLYCNRKLFRG